jgi:N-ethylmaleimide reductase
MSHASFHQDGQPVAPSALAPDAQVWVVNEKGEGQMVDCPQPRTLSRKDIHSIIADYRQAALNAVQAGFDGVEVHGGNGYLIDQFLRQTSNKRTDEYGGTLANRIRFAQEVLSAIAEAIGRERTGIRLSPFITQRGMNDPQVTEAILALAAWCEQEGIAFIHLAEADWDDAPQVPEPFRQSLRETFSGTLIVAGNYDLEKAEKILAAGYADLIAFGRTFIANPDLPHRLAHQLPLAQVRDPATLFGGTATGYTDYPIYTLQEKTL